MLSRLKPKTAPETNARAISCAPTVTIAGPMTGKRNEILTTDLKYPMVDLFTGGTVMPLMFVNVVTTWYVLSLTAPWLFTQAWMKELERESALYNHARHRLAIVVPNLPPSISGTVSPSAFELIFRRNLHRRSAGFSPLRPRST